MSGGSDMSDSEILMFERSMHDDDEDTRPNTPNASSSQQPQNDTLSDWVDDEDDVFVSLLAVTPLACSIGYKDVLDNVVKRVLDRGSVVSMWYAGDELFVRMRTGEQAQRVVDKLNDVEIMRAADWGPVRIGIMFFRYNYNM